MTNKTKDMIHCGLLTAILCVISPFAVPVGPVPVTPGLGVIVFCAVSAGAKKSAISAAIYLFLGAVGLPVFAFARSGFPCLLSLTGGYLWSYIPVALVCGFFAYKFSVKIMPYIGALSGILVCYLCGIFQYALLGRVDFYQALKICVLPFVLFDIAKCALGVWLGLRIRKVVFNRLT